MIEKREGNLKYGLRELDEMTGGMAPGELIVIGSRPGLGKTTLALNIADNVMERIKEDEPDGEKQKKLFFFSMEMDATELLGALPEKEQEGGLPQIRRHPLYMNVEKYSELRLEQVRAEVERAVEKSQLALVVIDYLQLMEGDKGDIASGLKKLAVDINAPVLLLSQLSREVDEEGRKPQLSDLRDCSALAETADSVILLHEDSKDVLMEVVELFVAKSRSGACGVMFAGFDKGRRRFSEPE